MKTQIEGLEKAESEVDSLQAKVKELETELEQA